MKRWYHLECEIVPLSRQKIYPPSSNGCILLLDGMTWKNYPLKICLYWVWSILGVVHLYSVWSTCTGCGPPVLGVVHLYRVWSTCTRSLAVQATHSVMGTQGVGCYINSL